ncbi:MAG: hypothetical protein IJJ41_10180 [Clostridia bacterium]|nr:hypothetical protein [Clostridia bacterium]
MVNIDKENRDSLSYEEKNHKLYLQQKELLATLLEHRAISKEQYQKSLTDLTEKMGYTNESF